MFLVYNIKRNHGSAHATGRLRQAAAELFVEAILSQLIAKKPDESIIQRLGSLVALFEIKTDKDIAPHLANELFGILVTRFNKPFEQIIELDEQSRIIALYCLDMRLATLNYDDAKALPAHVKDMVEKLYSHTAGFFWQKPYNTNSSLLLLSFQAVMLFDPVETGTRRLVDEFAGADAPVPMEKCIQRGTYKNPDLKRQWFHLCIEYATLFQHYEEWGWGRDFWNGVKQTRLWGKLKMDDRSEGSSALAVESLKRFGLDREMQREGTIKIAESKIRRVKGQRGVDLGAFL